MRMSSNCALCLADSSLCSYSLRFYCSDRSRWDRFATVTARLSKVSIAAVSSYLQLVLIALQTQKVSLLFLSPSFSKEIRKVHREVQLKSAMLAFTPSCTNLLSSCLSLMPSRAMLLSIIDSEEADTLIVFCWFYSPSAFYFFLTTMVGCCYPSFQGDKISLSLLNKRDRSANSSFLQFLDTPHSKIAVSSKVSSLARLSNACLSFQYNCVLLLRSTNVLNINIWCSTLNFSTFFSRF